ncbi:cobalamin-binding protein [Pseudoalteromonas sp. A41-2]|jgi:vitamin B12 transport system substrate-binding protein|nr:cobalamin-binding protein [Pseudoalteromonas sp. MT33b]QPL42190.1 cobalamin-binding protein [Pseudoalteromonas sp. A41-2]
MKALTFSCLWALMWLAQFSYAHEIKEPQRIVALAPHIVENLFAIGAGDRIVGTVDYADYPAQANEIERVGGYYGINMERLLSLKPDLVLAWKTGNKAEDLAYIEKLGIPVAYSNPDQVDNVADELRKLGELTHLKTRADRVATEFEVKLAAIRASQQDKPPVSVFYQLWPEPMMTVGGNTWINQLLTICHADNVFANSETDYPRISIENVLVSKPEVIIIPDEKSKKPQPQIDWRQWPELPAVQHNQFISVNADLLHRFTTRMLDGLSEMCGKIDISRKQIQASK